MSCFASGSSKISHYDYASFSPPVELSSLGYSPGLITPAISHSWKRCTHNIGPTSPKITPNSELMQTFMCKTLLHWWEMKTWHRRNTSSQRSPESEAAQTVSKISLFAKEPETSASQSDSPQLECECSELNSTGMDWVWRGTAQWKEVSTICLVNTQLREKMVPISWKGLLLLFFFSFLLSLL